MKFQLLYDSNYDYVEEELQRMINVQIERLQFEKEEACVSEVIYPRNVTVKFAEMVSSCLQNISLNMSEFSNYKVTSHFSTDRVFILVTTDKKIYNIFRVLSLELPGLEFSRVVLKIFKAFRNDFSYLIDVGLKPLVNGGDSSNGNRNDGLSTQHNK